MSYHFRSLTLFKAWLIWFGKIKKHSTNEANKTTITVKGISAIKSPNVPVISAKPENAMIVVIVAEKTGGAILMAAFSAATMGFSPKLRALKSAGSIIPAVIEGGKSKIGLESTIIDVSGSVPILLRPGGLIIEDIQTVLGTITLKNQKKVLNSPGQLESHYAHDNLHIFQEQHHLFHTKHHVFLEFEDE